MTSTATRSAHAISYRTINIDGQDIFYREAGSKDLPNVLLLHGFPSSSHMFRNLIPMLADHYHVIAPDYPGYGYSSMPATTEYKYNFDNMSDLIDKFTVAIGLDKFAMYVQDYGAPIGYRIAAKHPERIQAIIVQNGNAYVEGLDNKFWQPIKEFWADRSEATTAPLTFLVTLDATKWQYLNGVRNPEAISPDAWSHDQTGLDRPGNAAIQLDMLHDYRSNAPLYPQWQEYFRTHQPPMLIVWGKNDEIFPAAGAEPYKRDVKNLEYHLLDTGHFALEEDCETIGSLINQFLAKVHA
jgi:pimeloyl-ACP methyl ester carboxylesterase